MTTQHTLASLKEALQQPFAPETIGFLPKDIHQENGKTVCLALPYANKRVYEDRLNAVVYGEWSTPYMPPSAQGNKLIIPATVVILGLAHTDYGEAYFTTTGKGGNTREDDNTATEAYSQAFRRACAKFLLGRYLYDLPKLTLPYDPKTHQIALSKGERIAWVEKLYLEHGLIQPRSSSPVRHSIVQTVAKEQDMAPSATATPIVQQNGTTPAAQQKSAGDMPVVTHHPPSADKRSHTTAQPTNYPNDTFLDWVAQQVERDAERIQGICTYYQVQGLEKLSTRHRNELTQRLRQQATDKRSSSTSVLQTTH